MHKQTVLLLVDSPDLPENEVDIKVGSMYCTNKPGIHFPVGMFPSALWVKICLMTEQLVRIVSFGQAQQIHFSELFCTGLGGQVSLA